VSCCRLLVEADHTVGLIDADDAEATRVGQRHLNRRQRHIGLPLEMKAQHLRVVHLVHVIAREHDDVARRLAIDRVQVLKYRVGSAEIPMLSDSLLRRQNLDELAQFLGHDVPPHADVPVEGERLVLRRDENAAQSRIDAVAEREIDNPIWPTKYTAGFARSLVRG
jgi:hypothetical protein